MSHHRRLELRLLSTNSQPQLGQILRRPTVSSRSSDSAETASATSKAIGVAGSPNGRPGAPTSAPLPARPDAQASRKPESAPVANAPLDTASRNNRSVASRMDR